MIGEGGVSSRGGMDMDRRGRFTKFFGMSKIQDWEITSQVTVPTDDLAIQAATIIRLALRTAEKEKMIFRTEMNERRFTGDQHT